MHHFLTLKNYKSNAGSFKIFAWVHVNYDLYNFRCLELYERTFETLDTRIF